VPQERVLDLLAEEPTERQPKSLIRDHVQELHRLVLHRIHQPHAVDEIRRARPRRFVELGQLLGRHAQVTVEDDNKVTRRGGEASRNGPALAPALLLQDLDGPLRVFGGDALDFAPGVICRMAFDEDDLGPLPSSGVRRTASSMFPASLRAGTMTEQRYCRLDAGRGRGARSPRR